MGQLLARGYRQRMISCCEELAYRQFSIQWSPMKVLRTLIPALFYKLKKPLSAHSVGVFSPEMQGQLGPQAQSANNFLQLIRLPLIELFLTLMDINALVKDICLNRQNPTQKINLQLMEGYDTTDKDSKELLRLIHFVPTCPHDSEYLLPLAVTPACNMNSLLATSSDNHVESIARHISFK